MGNAFTKSDREFHHDQKQHPLIESWEWPHISSHLGLTEREGDVVIGVFQSQTIDDIASELGISARTVRQYLEQVYCKLDVHERVSLVLSIIECRDYLRAISD